MQSKPTVLIIDDENDIIEILTFLLNKQGMDVVSAEDGKAALHLLNTRTFSGVVSDLVMPNMNGIELLKAVRANRNTVPFIFLSGNANSVHEHEMINYGAYELIHKPDIENVPDALKKLFKADFEVKKLESGNDEAREFLDILHDTNKLAG